MALVLWGKWILENISRPADKTSHAKNIIMLLYHTINEPVHEISKNGVCATSKASDQPAHTRSLIRAFTSRLSIL